jgi:hypothetical protein
MLIRHRPRQLEQGEARRDHNEALGPLLGAGGAWDRLLAIVEAREE